MCYLPLSCSSGTAETPGRVDEHEFAADPFAGFTPMLAQVLSNSLPKHTSQNPLNRAWSCFQGRQGWWLLVLVMWKVLTAEQPVNIY